MANFVDLTTWIPVDDAKKMIKELIEQGKYEKHQIKKSSNLFANRKDKTDGYICRVLAEAGIHPELEIKKEEKKTKRVKKTEERAEETPTTSVDNRRYVAKAEPVGNNKGLFLIEQGGKFWVELQTIGSNEKEVLSNTVDTEAEAGDIWRYWLAKLV
ncbi:MAG: hypothetical protein IKB70_06340 [Bacilli bacterium]|nr:hypothetical protein [Bacilli bacterium]